MSHIQKKDPAEIENYRPIMLLNTDYKLLTKTMALLLMRSIRDLIHLDQVGFIPKRQIFCYELSLALLYADTSDCLLSSLPHPLIGLLYFYDLILLPPVLYDIHLVLQYDLSCTIHIYKPLIQLLVVLGEFRFPST